MGKTYNLILYVQEKHLCKFAHPIVRMFNSHSQYGQSTFRVHMTILSSTLSQVPPLALRCTFVLDCRLVPVLAPNPHVFVHAELSCQSLYLQLTKKTQVDNSFISSGRYKKYLTVFINSQEYYMSYTGKRQVQCMPQTANIDCHRTRRNLRVSFLSFSVSLLQSQDHIHMSLSMSCNRSIRSTDSHLKISKMNQLDILKPIHMLQ